MDVLIKWESKETCESVICQLLISKAGSVHSDPFLNAEKSSDQELHKFDLIKTSERLFMRSLYLPLGLYHFIFLIASSDTIKMDVSYYHNITVLGSGRSVNYIDVGAASPVSSTNSFSDCIIANDPDENTPLIEREVAYVSQNESSLCCFCCCPNKNT
nr:uncharacterized protein LOC105844531 [Hydra vulgaris]